MSKYYIFFIAIVVLFSSFTAPKKLSCDKNKSQLSYFMVHPTHSWEGINKIIVCNISIDDETGQINQVGVAANVANFDTENSSRDSHAMEVLEVLKFPRVTFLSTSIKEIDSKLEITGNLTFHGVKKEISFEANRENTKEEIIITGSLPVKLTDYNIERPSLLMVPVEDEMKISFNIVFQNS